MSVCYGATFEVEFRGVGMSKGPKQALHFKIFPKGKCEIPGVLIGFPALDTVPHGLGHRVQQTVHVFDALGVSLPRLELDRKDGYRAALAEYEKGPGDLAFAARESCCITKDVSRATAIVDAPDYLLSPGDEAMVPIAWDRQVPDKDFGCMPLRNDGIEALPGVWSGGCQTGVMCVTNETLTDQWIERGMPIARKSSENQACTKAVLSRAMV